ncbi:hypothetical protein SLA2020_469710 [Shorea laevis]
MGACLSIPNPKPRKTGTDFGVGGAPAAIKQHPTAKVVHMDGRIQEFKPPIQAKHVTSQNPGDYFLCSSESMSIIGTSVPAVPDDEELQPDQIYFLLPLSHSNKALSLPDLCTLAVKASSGLSQGSISNSMFILQ